MTFVEFKKKYYDTLKGNKGYNSGQIIKVAPQVFEEYIGMLLDPDISENYRGDLAARREQWRKQGWGCTYRGVPVVREDVNMTHNGKGYRVD